MQKILQLTTMHVNTNVSCRYIIIHPYSHSTTGWYTGSPKERVRNVVNFLTSGWFEEFLDRKI